MVQNIDWNKLTFHYTEPDYVVRAACKDGKWEEPYATTDKTITLHVAATGLQYGQQVFEGLKAFRGADGRVRIFRMTENAHRMIHSAQGLMMTPPPADLFCRAVRLALTKNIDFLPPYETGATLYFRPVLIATTPEIAVTPGKDCELIVIPSPIGAYFPGKFHCTPFIVERHIDRAAPFGTGIWKVGGNYGSSFRATETAHAQGFDCMFTDAKTHKYIDECSAANFIGIKQLTGSDGKQVIEYLTPRSTAILPSITNDSLMTLAREMGMKVTRRHIRVEELADMQEAAACGTACVISPIGRIYDPDKSKTYSFGEKPGPVMTRLFNALQDIQYGRAEDRHGWTEIIEL
ncbi:MAG: branched-chain amino acid aminotransferase [Paludibacteraceae bacterium]|nr:branched-chain amino acid aminotransferase [Paludibacteraceae bacterium]